MLITQSVTNILDGVSQKSLTSKKSSQAIEQVNCRTIGNKGIIKRPPTEFLCIINNLNPDKSYFYHMMGDRYLLVIGDSKVQIYDKTGYSFTTTFYDKYLDNVHALKAYTTANTTFILNTEQVVGKDNSLVERDGSFYSVVHIKKAIANFEYEIELYDTDNKLKKTVKVSLANSPTPERIAKQFALQNISYFSDEQKKLLDELQKKVDDATIEYVRLSKLRSKETSLEIEEKKVIQKLREDDKITSAEYTKRRKALRAKYTKKNEKLNYDIKVQLKIMSNSGEDLQELKDQSKGMIDTSGFNIGAINSNVLLYRPTKEYHIRIKNSANRSIFDVINNTVQSLDQLPSDLTREGFRVRVIGNSTDNFTGYYVKSTSSGKWVESVATNATKGFLHNTMPMVLKQNDDATFNLAFEKWDNRKVGNDDIVSNPDPSFINRKINDLTFYQNRLGFLTELSTSFSESGIYTNYFQTTMTTLVSSDPIDIKPSSKDSLKLYHMVQTSGNLVLFSDRSQFIVSMMQANKGFSIENISVTEHTHYSSDKNVTPITLNDYVYFLSGKRILEFKQIEDQRFSADDITIDIPTYIKGRIKDFVVSGIHNTLFLLTDHNIVYVNHYQIENKQKTFSSWSKWNFNKDYIIETIKAVDNILFILFKIADKFYLEAINLELERNITKISYKPHLDTQMNVANNAIKTISETNQNYIPYNELPIVKRSDNEKWQVISSSLNFIGDLTFDDYSKRAFISSIVPIAHNDDLVIGVTYTMQYTLPTIMYRSTRTEDPILGGRLQLRSLNIEFSNTGCFDLKLEYNNGNHSTIYKYTTKYLDQITTNFNDNYQLLTYSDNFYALVASQNTAVIASITSDHTLPVEINGYSWEGYYVKRGTKYK